MPYVAGLDGLRAVAVLAVLLYHGRVRWFDGGYLGVEAFFVISGYLITALLLQEDRLTPSISLRQFWIRRARRLLPALYVLLVGVVIMAALVATDAMGDIRRQIVGALFYVTNWQLIITDQSYFEAFGRPSPLQHLWSLAVEEQFYLLWPIVMVAGLRILGRVRLLQFTLTGIIASTAWMWFLYEPLTDPSRVYYGSDTRVAGMLVGAALAFLWQPWRMGRVWTRERGPMARITDGLGIAGLVGLIWLFHTLLEDSARLYRGGFLITSSLTAVVIAAATVPTGRLGGWLAVGPMRWIGQRSYSIYLWHWPIFVFTRPRLDTTLDGLTLLTVRFVLTFVAAELSYRVIELPVRERRLAASARTFGRALSAGDGDARRRGLLVVGLIVLVPLTVVAMQSSELSPVEASDGAVADVESVVVTERPVATLGSEPGAGPPATSSPPVETGPGHGVVAVGDSVMVAAADTLSELLPGLEVDALIGRQWWTVTDDLQIDIGRADTVVVHLGSNGAPNGEMIDALIESIGPDTHVLLVTVRAPVRWESAANEALRAAAALWPNVDLVEWRLLADEQWSWFEADGVHLTKEGEVAYVDLIARSV